jgi:2,5-diketo-D-gluconate reductase B
MVAAVPRALEDDQIAENLNVFDFSLSDTDMRKISTLRSRKLRIANPLERAPKWDVGDVETIA